MRKYKLLKRKGEGTFSEVLAAQNIKTGDLCAIKCMKQTFESLDQVNNLREIQALRRLSPHNNIIKLHEVLYDKPTGRLALVFELMSFNMYELIRGRRRYLDPGLVKIYAWQMMQAVAHGHRKGIFHRDIKPENVLLSPTVDVHEGLKLADFGSCRGIYSKQPYTEYISTRWYRAPECLLTDGYYGPEMDIWGVACVIFEISALFPLFPGTDERDQIKRVHAVVGTPGSSLLSKFRAHGNSHIDFNFPPERGSGLLAVAPHLDPQLVDLLNKMLVYDPKGRYTAEQCLAHPYFDELRSVPMPSHDGDARTGTTTTAGSSMRTSADPSVKDRMDGTEKSGDPLVKKKDETAKKIEASKDALVNAPDTNKPRPDKLGSSEYASIRDLGTKSPHNQYADPSPTVPLTKPAVANLKPRLVAKEVNEVVAVKETATARTTMREARRASNSSVLSKQPPRATKENVISVPVGKPATEGLVLNITPVVGSSQAKKPTLLSSFKGRMTNQVLQGGSGATLSTSSKNTSNMDSTTILSGTSYSKGVKAAEEYTAQARTQGMKFGTSSVSHRIIDGSVRSTPMGTTKSTAITVASIARELEQALADSPAHSTAVIHQRSHAMRATDVIAGAREAVRSIDTHAQTISTSNPSKQSSTASPVRLQPVGALRASGGAGVTDSSDSPYKTPLRIGGKHAHLQPLASERSANREAARVQLLQTLKAAEQRNQSGKLETMHSGPPSGPHNAIDTGQGALGSLKPRHLSSLTSAAVAASTEDVKMLKEVLRFSDDKKAIAPLNPKRPSGEEPTRTGAMRLIPLRAA